MKQHDLENDTVSESLADLQDQLPPSDEFGKTGEQTAFDTPSFDEAFAPPATHSQEPYSPAHETDARVQPHTPAPQPNPRVQAHTPAPQPNAEIQARLARLQVLSLERPAHTPTASSRPSRVFVLLPWFLLGIVVSGGGFYHVQTVRDLEQRATRAAAPQPAVAATPEPSAGVLLASGYIAAKAPITLSATASGRVKEVTVEVGDSIAKGQILARLADDAVRAELSLATARVRDASRLHGRTAMLVKAQAATRAELERSFGAVEVARAEMKVIEQKIDEMKVRSPINGTVLEVLARPGESLTAGQNESAAILRIADLSALIAEVDVAEAELKHVFVGQDAEITSEAQRGHTFKGVVREIAEQADRARGTVLVKVDVIIDQPPQPAEQLAPEPPPLDEKPAPKRGKAATNKPGKERPPSDPTPEPAPVEPPKQTAPTLRPGMAAQVRFIPKQR